jgi:transposase
MLRREKLEKEKIAEVMKAIQEQMIKGDLNAESAEAKKYKELKQKTKKQKAESRGC